jgi:hypothetical protein
MTKDKRTKTLELIKSWLPWEVRDQIASYIFDIEQALDAALETARNMEQQRDQEAAIVSRIWEQLGNPSYESLNGRSIYDLIDDLLGKTQPPDDVSTATEESSS